MKLEEFVGGVFVALFFIMLTGILVKGVIWSWTGILW